MGSDHSYLDSGGRDWAKQQLLDAGHDELSSIHQIAQKIFDAVDAVADAYAEDIAVALPIFTKLLSGKALTEADWSSEKMDEGFRWLPVLPRMVEPGDVVRVRQDAYSDPDKSKHNGQQGRVSAVRNGVYVIYDSMARQGATVMGIRHEISALEKRVERRPRH